MLGPKIKLDKSLYERVAEAAQKAGYSSTDEFVTHVLERAVVDLEDVGGTDDEVEKQLRGLGYLE